MTIDAQSAHRFRWILLSFALSCMAAGLFWLGGYLFFEEKEAADWLLKWFIVLFIHFEPRFELVAYLLFFGGILLAQWLFLRPRGEWRVHLAERARPMKSAIVVAAFMAMLISVGILGTLLEVHGPKTWVRILGLSDDSLWIWFAVILTVWLLWGVVFYVYWGEGERYSQIGKMIRGLIAGSFLELFVAIGVYAWNPHNDDCWCARGSYTGVVFGATVMIWAFGPGLLLVFLRKKRERSERHAGGGQL